MHAYPTPLHAAAADSVVQFFAHRPETGAVVLVNSCARGKATPESDLDLVALVAPDLDTSGLDSAWQRFRTTDPAIDAYIASSPLAVLHLDIEPAVIDVPDHLPDEYPDGFELAIGNWLVWSAVLWEQPGFVDQFRAPWLPYYDNDLRQQRLAELRAQCETNLRLIPHYVRRDLHFQAFSRIWDSFQLFMQALFIQHRTYPIAYNKWIREQVVDILHLPGLYQHLPPLLELPRLESDILATKAEDLSRLWEEYIPPARSSCQENITASSPDGSPVRDHTAGV